MIPELVHLSEKLKSRVETGRITLEYPSASSLRVLPKGDDTFKIDAEFVDGAFLVSVAAWHGQFELAEQASAVICWLLTPYYRVVRSICADQNLATWIEIYTNEGWEGTEYVYFGEPMESPLDGADGIVILTQAVFLDSAFETYYPAAHLDQARYPIGTILGETQFENQKGEWQPVGIPVAE